MKTPVSSDLYDRDYYSKYNHGFEVFESTGDLMQELKAKLDNYDFHNKKVLDIGCGRGEFVVYALKKGASEVVGIDYSQASVDIANQFINTKLPDLKHKANIHKMDAKLLEFSDSYFDVVVMLDIVEHLHDWELTKCIDETVRILKPNGSLYVHTSPNKIMMSIVRLLVGFIGVKLKSSEFHVNEQSYTTLKKHFANKFIGKIVLEKDVNYWRNQMGFRSNTVKKLAGLLDKIVDSKIIHSIMQAKPFNIIFCTDLWFIGYKQ